MGNCLETILGVKRTPYGQTQLHQTIIEDSLTVRLRTDKDPQFLYYVQYSELEQKINHIMQDPDNLQSNKPLINDLLAEVKGYLDSIDSLHSPMYSKLNQIQEKLNHHIGKSYICIQIQEVMLYDSKKKEYVLEIASAKDRVIQTVNVNKIVTNKKKSKKEASRNSKTKCFAVGSLLKLFDDFEGFMTLKVEGESCSTSINLLDIEQQLAIAQVFNLRNPNQMEAVGQIAVRVESIKNVQTWKAKNRKLLGARVKQLERILVESNKSYGIGLTGGKVMIRSSISQRNNSVVFSYYDQPIQ